MIKVENLSMLFSTEEVQTKALNEVTFEIEKGEFVAIMGPSGCGKSTLLNILGTLDTPTSGSYLFEGKRVDKMNENQLTALRKGNIGFIFQSFNLIDELTVYENVEVAANLTGNPNENKILKRRRNYREIMNALEAVDMWQMKDRFPKELSGGQQQRVSIATATVKKPRMLLCDEPTGALDVEMSIQVMKVLKRLNAEQRTNVIIITHNPVIAEMAHKVITIKNGMIAEERINENPKSVEMIEW